jgi:hypothetical protein
MRAIFLYIVNIAARENFARGQLESDGSLFQTLDVRAIVF